jgi:nitrogen fixation protein NifU and related proteins
MAIKYSEKVMDHFMNPRNVGELEAPDGIGEVGNPACGDIMTFTIKVKDNKLADVKFKTFGCGAAIAVSSMISEMAIGKTLDEAMKITNKDVALQLEGLPANKMHCSNLGADALHAAIESYKKSSAQNLAKPEKVVAAEKEDHDHGDEHYTRKCPSCDIPVPPGLPSCAKCGCEVKERD